eukprot:COSAG06_NODE_8259_length_2222_cov_1.724918_2_plen_48_part_00
MSWARYFMLRGCGCGRQAGSDEEFATLMETLDEDNSNKIDYNEFANR